MTYVANDGMFSIGLDINKYLIEMAKRQARKFNINNTFFILGDAKHLPFKSKIFNNILFSEIIEHIECSPKKALKEIRRVLKGIVVVTAPTSNRFPWSFINRIYPFIGEAHTKYIPKQIFSLLKYSNLRVERVLGIGILPLPNPLKSFPPFLRFEEKLGTLVPFTNSGRTTLFLCSRLNEEEQDNLRR